MVMACFARHSFGIAHVLSISVSKSSPRIVAYEAWLEEDGVSIRVGFAARPFFEIGSGVVCVAYG